MSTIPQVAMHLATASISKASDKARIPEPVILYCGRPVWQQSDWVATFCGSTSCLGHIADLMETTPHIHRTWTLLETLALPPENVWVLHKWDTAIDVQWAQGSSQQASEAVMPTGRDYIGRAGTSYHPTHIGKLHFVSDSRTAGTSPVAAVTQILALLLGTLHGLQQPVGECPGLGLFGRVTRGAEIPSEGVPVLTLVAAMQCHPKGEIAGSPWAGSAERAAPDRPSSKTVLNIVWHQAIWRTSLIDDLNLVPWLGVLCGLPLEPGSALLIPTPPISGPYSNPAFVEAYYDIPAPRGIRTQHRLARDLLAWHPIGFQGPAGPSTPLRYFTPMLTKIYPDINQRKVSIKSRFVSVRPKDRKEIVSLQAQCFEGATTNDIWIQSAASNWKRFQEGRNTASRYYYAVEVGRFTSLTVDSEDRHASEKHAAEDIGIAVLRVKGPTGVSCPECSTKIPRTALSACHVKEWLYLRTVTSGPDALGKYVTKPANGAICRNFWTNANFPSVDMDISWCHVPEPEYEERD
ncbi:hypothetical protein C8Q79DRAFT_1024924 [Trametes meyenii]|nr:hypothetical protein C8Q79DRAFT_1024924 [Trametes meyenii]